MKTLIDTAIESSSSTDCVKWKGYKDKDGYGRYGSSLAHRLVYQRAIGLIPNGYEVDHTCSQRDCVNVEHLEAVTRSENVRRMYELYTHCIRGHEYTDENTYKNPSGTRACRKCIARNSRNYKERKAQKL